MRARLALGTIVALIALTPARALETPWVPANAGVLWWQPNDPAYPLSIPRQPPGEPAGAWWLTRRIAASPHVPGLLHLGSFFHGMYGSAGGAAWGTLTPACWLPVNPPAAVPPEYHTLYREARRAAVSITGLEGCGIEGIVYDPFLPNRLYVTAYDVVSLVGVSATLGPGGVFVSDTAGATWRKLLGGIRGNGLAVHREIGGAATIVAGYIQEGSVVGSTPSNGSLSISRDDGRTWRDVVLPASGCADIPVSSQRITPTVAINPTDADQIFAGTNAGLYVTSDGGQTWALQVKRCDGVWGIALTSDGGTIFIGDKDGVVSRASTSTLAFEQIVDLGAGKVQTLLLDARDPDQESLYAATWAGGDAAVYRIDARASAKGRLGDSLLRDVIPLDQGWPAGVPKPFPLAFAMADGTAPSLFLGQALDVLYVSTVTRGVFLRLD